jgi:exopolysaccharide biosynthesis polyprenyl glycosylphosphotransferase
MRRPPARTLVVGTGPRARELLREVRQRPDCGYRVIGLVGDSAGIDPPDSDEPVLGSLEDLPRIIAECAPERIVVALSERRGRMPVNDLLDARVHRNSIVEDGEDVFERISGKVAIESLRPSNVIYCKDFTPSAPSLALARCLSVLLATFALLLLAPLLAIIALAIKLDSGGPALFVQERVGMGSRRINVIKFRTMHPSATEHSKWVRDNDHRITRIGRWLRKYRLDELPQLVNVLRGEMNIVGPRPHPVSNFEMFVLVARNTPECGRPIPYYSLRSIVRPGITGWAQVRYRYANDLDEEIEKMRYDLFYIKHYSLWLDLRILLETVGIVLRGREGVEAADNPLHAGRGSRWGGAGRPETGPASRPVPAFQSATASRWVAADRSNHGAEWKKVS